MVGGIRTLVQHLDNSIRDLRRRGVRWITQFWAGEVKENPYLDERIVTFRLYYRNVQTADL